MVHSSRLRIGSPVVVWIWRLLRRVTMTSPGWACCPCPIAVDTVVSSWSAAARAVWTVSLIASTCWLVAAVTATVLTTARWLRSQSLGDVVEVFVELAGVDPAVIRR